MAPVRGGAWLVYDQTHSEFMLGIIEVASLMPGLLVGLFAGVLADRVAPVTMVVVMEFGQMGLALVLATLVGLQVVQIWQMVAILALSADLCHVRASEPPGVLLRAGWDRRSSPTRSRSIRVSSMPPESSGPRSRASACPPWVRRDVSP